MKLDGEKIKRRLEELGMTQKELAAATGLKKSTIDYIVRGRHFVREASARMIAAALGAEIAELKIRVVKVCARCGKEFEPTDGKQKYCGAECADEAGKLKTREWNRKTYWAKKKGGAYEFDLQMFGRSNREIDQTIDDNRWEEEPQLQNSPRKAYEETTAEKLSLLIRQVECDYESAYRTTPKKPPGEVRTAWAKRTTRLEQVLKKLRAIEADLKQDNFLMELAVVVA